MEYIAKDLDLERSICAILMHDPAARRASLEIAPSFLDAFVLKSTTKLARICMESDGLVTPIFALSFGGWEEGWLDKIFDSYAKQRPEHVTLMVTRLVNLWRQRRLMEHVEKIDADLEREREDIDDLAVKHIDSVSAILSNGADIRDAKVAARIQSIKESIEKGNIQSLVPTGLGSLDSEYIGGIDLSGADYWIIAGKKGVGKTRLTVNVVRNLLGMLDDLRVCWISTESGFTPNKLAALMICQEATASMNEDGLQSIDGKRWWVHPRDYMAGIENSSFYEVTGDYVREAEERISKWNLWVYGPARDDGGARSLSNALALMQRAVDVHGCNLVILDNYQQIEVDGLRPGENPDYAIMKAVVGRVSGLVSSRGVAHIGVLQLGRSGKVLGGDAAGYETNVELFVEREDKKGNDLPDDEFNLVATKARDGPRFRIRFQWEPVTGLIVDSWNDMD